MALQYKRVLLKLSGEALGNSDDLYDAKKIYDIAKQIVKLQKEGLQIAIVVGGGNIWRGNRADTIKMNPISADYMGMLATVMNALALEAVLKNEGSQNVVVTSKIQVPEVASPYLFKKAKAALEKGAIVIMAGGTGQPKFTTDTAATIRAIEIDADVMLMAKNGVDGIYDKDPRHNADAVRFDNISLNELQKKQLKVMDLTASSLAMEDDVKIVVFDINEPDNIYKAAHGNARSTIVTGGKK
ncbi:MULTISPECIES: UMP kinase [Spiroplasma]|uniref:Uridylate kinase n=2 Tax=Spiroplasma melliferum TaxID=2134 RepID=A0AAI9T2Q7_SPIME|nr:UMP kinase [Spiroplasma melliferum]ELL44232.1 uridylate kinase [Spiroplasma melliferum IPMB4A]KAI92204.1 uridylate kinase [Spiroplasma melliferum KC3]MBH8623684.1 UMP kinase [Spiroplasma sp. Moj]QCO23622.1 uridylate kinase [Spiroplasma melliferum]